MANKKENKVVSSIGGQAVIEGVMMRGKKSMATALRDHSGKIIVESSRLTPPEKQNKFLKLPLIRGVVSLLTSLVGGTKVLMRSASVFGDDETSVFDDVVSGKNSKSNAMDIAIYFSVFLGVCLSLFLFFFLPQRIADFFFTEKTNILYFLIEGGVRIVIFVVYILLTSLLKDVNRTYMYHGAEHKTISCYESGLELTVENVKTCTRVHDRCGTTFTFIVMFISILVFALVNGILASLNVSFDGVIGSLLRFGVKLLCLPLVAGISYEILKGLAKTKNKFFNIFKAPGLLLQRLTTKEPTNDMIEVAITAFKTVLEMDEDESIPTSEFTVCGNVATLTERVKRVFKKHKIDESDAEWLVALTLNIKRSEVYDVKRTVTSEEVYKVAEYSKQRITGKPLAYVLNSAEFYGYEFYVDENVLIPRPETEELCNLAIKSINENSTVLDMCTGSGAIAITVNKQTGASVTAVDVDENALKVATKNATNLGANVNFINSNMFENVVDTYDVIISNPPYIKSGDLASLQNEVKFEPLLALDGGNDGLNFYRIIATDGAKHLKPNGLLFIEYGLGESLQIKEILQNSNNFKNVEIIKDINGIDRIIKAERV